MIIVCLSIVILSMSLATISFKKNMDDVIAILFVIGATVSTLSLIICIPSIIVEQCNTNKKICSKQLEYESLVKQCEIISSNYEDVSKANVIQKVYEWNVEVYDEKYWANSIWTNWFWNQKVVNSLEYIDLEDYGL